MAALKTVPFRMLIASASAVAVVALGSVNASAAPLVLTPTSTTLSSTVSSPVTGQITRLKAVVVQNPGTGLPTGTVTFTDGGSAIPGGTGLPLLPVNGHMAVSVNFTPLTAGLHSLLATYSGDSLNDVSSSPLAMTVGLAATTVPVVATPRTGAGAYTIAGQIKVTKPGAGIPTGTATFTVDATPPAVVPLDTFGHAHVNLTFAVASVHTVTVDYSGDANYGASSSGLVTFTANLGGGFTPLPSFRLLDTRSGTGGVSGPVAGRGTARFVAIGLPGPVPASGVSAVLLTVTVTQSTGAGFLTVYAGGTAVPAASSLNFVKGQTVANSVVVPVGADGSVAVFNGSGGSAQIVADVSGYYATGTPTVPGAFGPLPSARILDTRAGIGGVTGPVIPRGQARFPVRGVGGVPASGVSAVALNVTVTGSTAGGFLTVFAGGTSQPGASSLNFTAGQTVANLVFVPVGADGSVTVANGSDGRTQMIADVVGYVASGGASVTGAFGPLASARVLDTRIGAGGISGPVGGTATARFVILGAGGVPLTGVSSVVLNVTVTGPTANGFVTVFAGGTTKPGTSNLNYTTGQTVANLVVVPVGADGSVSLYNGSGGSVQMIADVAGYYLS